MSDISFNQYGRLNDALERDLMQRTLGNGESVSIVAVAKSIHRGLRKAAVGVGRYIISVTQALNDARARDAEFCGSQW